MEEPLALNQDQAPEHKPERRIWIAYSFGAMFCFTACNEFVVLVNAT